METQPLSLQLQWFQTLREIAAEKNATVVVPDSPTEEGGWFQKLLLLQRQTCAAVSSKPWDCSEKALSVSSRAQHFSFGCRKEPAQEGLCGTHVVGLRTKKKCNMKFLDADVQRPLASVSVIVDE